MKRREEGGERESMMGGEGVECSLRKLAKVMHALFTAPTRADVLLSPRAGSIMPWEHTSVSLTVGGFTEVQIAKHMHVLR